MRSAGLVGTARMLTTGSALRTSGGGTEGDVEQPRPGRRSVSRRSAPRPEARRAGRRGTSSVSRRPLALARLGRRRRRASRAGAAAAEAGRDHRHPQLVAHRLVDDGAEDDVRVRVARRPSRPRPPRSPRTGPMSRPPVTLRRMPVAPSIDASSSGEETARPRRLGRPGSRRARCRCPSAPCRPRA